MIEMRLKKNARPRSHCRNPSSAAIRNSRGPAETGSPTGRPDVPPLPQRGLDHRAAHFHFRAYRLLASHFPKDHVIDRMRTNRAKRIGRKLGNFRPIYHRS